MKYSHIIKGIFLERLHRFGALVDIGETVEYVHVKNTGRCKELLIKGVTVFLQKSNNQKRKTKYSIISVFKGTTLVNIDSQVPNEVVYDALLSHAAEGFPRMEIIKREVTYSNSRFDIYYEAEGGVKGFIEVKGVTLDLSGTAMFPDAPTPRGRKHLIELAEASCDGFVSHVVFLVQYRPVNLFVPNKLTDPAFSEALKYAAGKGVSIHVYDCLVTEDGIELGVLVPYKID